MYGRAELTRRCNIDIDGDERACGAFLLSARLGEFACFERLALEARFVLSALARARLALYKMFISKIIRTVFIT